MPDFYSFARGLAIGFNALGFGHILFTHGFACLPTSGISMMPTMDPTGTWVLISKHYRRGRDVKVGDVVDFLHPYVPNTGVVKRVVGMPGDFVLEGTPYKGDGTMVQVPEGHCWVAGDNQTWSRDSRVYGPIPLPLIKGKIIMTVWPRHKFGPMVNTLRPLDDDGLLDGP
ncbi:peptidase S24/S26A/S26B/S26C [Lineolata rhizophorae]|uniref:Peptidase S24/S26A/S26B/S26C n=1 Tax=Lineolata rhizophorae TaxID=578093 RepID=A0A6A6PEA1_9PEZI|nr:peptidase S24/S26A/S26B/S26C [Lineolata rhizophorae]